MDVVIGMPQMFKRNLNDQTEVMIAKYVDGMIFAARTRAHLKDTYNAGKQAFTVGQWIEKPEFIKINTSEVIQTSTVISIKIQSLAREIGKYQFPQEGPRRPWKRPLLWKFDK